MKRITLVIVLSAALLGCPGSDQGSGKSAPKPLSASELAAGKAIAERDCKGCHGLDGRAAAPGIPHLAAQRLSYLIAALEAYKAGKRTHAALREIATHLNDAETRNIAGYYASLPPVQAEPGAQSAYESPYEHGRKIAAQALVRHPDTHHGAGFIKEMEAMTGRSDPHPEVPILHIPELFLEASEPIHQGLAKEHRIQAEGIAA